MTYTAVLTTVHGIRQLLAEESDMTASILPTCEEAELDEQWSFVKLEKMHDTVIGLLINKVEFGRDVCA